MRTIADLIMARLHDELMVTYDGDYNQRSWWNFSIDHSQQRQDNDVTIGSESQNWQPNILTIGHSVLQHLPLGNRSGQDRSRSRRTQQTKQQSATLYYWSTEISM